MLFEHRLARFEPDRSNGGRPAERWFYLAPTCDRSDQSQVSDDNDRTSVVNVVAQEAARESATVVEEVEILTIQALVIETVTAGITLQTNGDKLRVKGPIGAVTRELRDALSARRVELLTVLTRLEGMRTISAGYRYRAPRWTRKAAVIFRL